MTRRGRCLGLVYESQSPKMTCADPDERAPRCLACGELMTHSAVNPLSHVTAVRSAENVLFTARSHTVVKQVISHMSPHELENYVRIKYVPVRPTCSFNHPHVHFKKKCGDIACVCRSLWCLHSRPRRTAPTLTV